MRSGSRSGEGPRLLSGWELPFPGWCGWHGRFGWSTWMRSNPWCEQSTNVSGAIVSFLPTSSNDAAASKAFAAWKVPGVQSVLPSSRGDPPGRCRILSLHRQATVELACLAGLHVADCRRGRAGLHAFCAAALSDALLAAGHCTGGAALGRAGCRKDDRADCTSKPVCLPDIRFRRELCPGLWRTRSFQCRI